MKNKKKINAMGTMEVILINPKINPDKNFDEWFNNLSKEQKKQLKDIKRKKEKVNKLL